MYNGELFHYGVKGMQWGVQNSKYKAINSYISNKSPRTHLKTKNKTISQLKYKLKGDIKLDNSLKKEAKAEKKAEEKAPKKTILGVGYDGKNKTITLPEKSLMETYGTADAKEINSLLSPKYNAMNKINTVRENLDTFAKSDGAPSRSVATYDDKTMTVGINYINSKGSYVSITVSDPSLKQAVLDYRDHVDNMKAMEASLGEAIKKKVKAKKKQQQKNTTLTTVQRSGYGGYYE